MRLLFNHPIHEINITLTVIDNHNMSEEIRVSIEIIKISNVNMYILCGLKGQCLHHDHGAHVYEYMPYES